MNEASPASVFAALEAALPGVLPRTEGLRFAGAETGLPSLYPVGSFAAASVGLAVAAAARVAGLRRGAPVDVPDVDTRHAVVAFRSERYQSGVGWQIPPPWDPIAGDYATRDGFIRLHTNYVHHRAGVLRALGCSESKEEVARAVAASDGESLEAAIVAEGGCAAKLRTTTEFAEHPQGRAVASEPLFGWSSRRGTSLTLPDGTSAPLAGVRVLDLTRVIAGPVATRFLAAYGADVLRIDPPGFEEVPALLTETTAGKRRAALDLHTEEGRERFRALVVDAHVLVCGYRSDALERLGLGAAWRQSVNAGMACVFIDAYGWTGPWAQRRGFDSLVQMSTGIAAEGQRAAGTQAPLPLPAQALDHGTGYLAAAAACHALAQRLATKDVVEVRLSLARTALFLQSFGTEGNLESPELTTEDSVPYREEVPSEWGTLRRIRSPGVLPGFTPSWSIPPGVLGTDAPAW